MNWSLLVPFLIISVFYIATAILIYSHNKRDIINQIFCLFILSVVLWMTFNYLTDADMGRELLWSKLTFAGSSLMAIFLLYFSILFPDKNKNIPLYTNVLVIGVPTFFLIISAFSKLIVENVKIESWGTDIVPGALNFLYPIFFFSVMLISLIILYRKYKRSVGNTKNQLLYIFIGLLLSLIGGFYTNSISYFIIGNFSLAKYGPYATIFLLGFTAYAILAHHLFDIRVIIKKTVIYSTLLIFALGVYSLAIFSVSTIFGTTGALGIIPNIIAAALIIIGYGPLEKWLSEITDKWLFKGEFDPQTVLSKLSDSLSTVIDLNEALVSMMKTITEALRINRAATFVLRKSVKGNTEVEKVNDGGLEVHRVRAVGYDIEEKKIAEMVHPLIHYFEKNKNSKIVLYEDLVQGKDKVEFKETNLLINLHELKIALAMPVYTKDKLIGLFVLGEKLSGDIFSTKDLDLMEIAVKQTAAVIEKARFYEEDQLKSEFVSIASHELLTPTSAIEGYLSMILDEHLAKVDKKAEGYLRKVYASSKRLAALVKDLLNVSRIESGRIVMQWQAFDIQELINSVVEEVKPKSDEKKLKLEFKNSAKVKNPAKIMVFADMERMHQVLINLIGNSIKYTEAGGVTINLEVNPKSITGPAGEVAINVTDTGIGMCPEDQAHLFEKFYRASNAGKYGAGGTGLGLYISKNLTEMMGGTIKIKSEINKGSTFTATLKLATPEQIKNNSEKPVGSGIIPYKKEE